MKKQRERTTKEISEQRQEISKRAAEIYRQTYIIGAGAFPMRHTEVTDAEPLQ